MNALARYSPLVLLFPALALMGCERSGDGKIEKKLTNIENRLARIETLIKQGGGKGGQPQRRKRQVPDPKLTHAVPVGNSIAIGPANATVVLMEAFDFA